MSPEVNYPITLSCVRGSVNADTERIRVFTAEIPAEVVGTFFVEPALAAEGGFQRELDTARANRIGKLMAGNGSPPSPNVHGGLLAFATEEEVEVPRTGPGRLTIKRPLRLIDGQHRAAGARYAAEHGASYTEAVRVVVGATRQELAMWYLRTNMEARKVAPANIIVNVANMEGTVQRRKSWIARLTLGTAASEPFVHDGKSLITFSRGDGGRISAATLYRAIDVMLPERLNAEGHDTEAEAAEFVRDAFTVYSEAVSEWGAQDENGAFKDNDAYSFTWLVAFARLFTALWTPEADLNDLERDLRRGLSAVGDMAGIGSGERAALSLASFMAGKLGVRLEKVAA